MCLYRLIGGLLLTASPPTRPSAGSPPPLSPPQRAETWLSITTDQDSCLIVMMYPAPSIFTTQIIPKYYPDIPLTDPSTSIKLSQKMYEGMLGTICERFSLVGSILSVPCLKETSRHLVKSVEQGKTNEWWVDLNGFNHAHPIVYLWAE